MTFNEMIEKFMPFVNDGADSPILIYRNKTGEWYAQDVGKEIGSAHNIVHDAKENDPYAIIVKGSDFARGSFPYVYDKILTARLRAEYDTLQYSAATLLELNAVVNFFEDNLCELSTEVTDYMTALERPLYSMNEIKQYALFDVTSPYGYNEDRADEYINLIESHVEKHLNERAEDVVLNDNEKVFTVNPDDYTVLQSQKINNRLVTLSENPQSEYRYMVCEYWTNPKGVRENTETGVTNDHLEALERYTGKVHYYVSCALSERETSKRVKIAKEAFKENKEDKKPSLSERIEKGKKKVREADKNRSKPDKPKNHNKSVDD